MGLSELEKKFPIREPYEGEKEREGKSEQRESRRSNRTTGKICTGPEKDL